MELYILRHGIAEDRAPGVDDNERALTRKGKRKIKIVAKAMRVLGLRRAAVITSPLRRACETASVVAEKLADRKRLRITKYLEPAGNADQLIKWLISLRPRPARAVLVGHEPYLSVLIAFLTTGNFEAYADLKKGGLCRVDVDLAKEPLRGKLQWLLTPRLMANIAKGNCD